jgi:hypothetical protein
MTWSEHWTITEPDPALPVEARAIAGRLAEALAARGLAIGPAIVHEGGALEGAQLACYGRYIEVSLGVGDLRGAFTIARAEGDEPAYAELTSGDARGPWEPLYALFVELAAELGAAQEPPLGAAPDPGELREDVRTTVQACVADALYAEGLTPGEAVIADAGDPAAPPPPLEAFALDVELRADAVVARVTGAGERFVVVARGLAAGLSPEGRAALERALREELLACAAAHRRGRHRHVAPPADPTRGGKLFLERRDAGRLVSAEELTDALALRRALAEHDVDVICYFSSGEPFWKASYERGHEAIRGIEPGGPTPALDALHAERTWQWQALEADEGEVEEPAAERDEHEAAP